MAPAKGSAFAALQGMSAEDPAAIEAKLRKQQRKREKADREANKPEARVQIDLQKFAGEISSGRAWGDESEEDDDIFLRRPPPVRALPRPRAARARARALARAKGGQERDERFRRERHSLALARLLAAPM
jgi:hypothetical protein